MILYAIGYRPITTSLPQAVGVLLVRAIPSKATVSVNGTIYGILPRSIPNLVPGIVDVKITKQGYQDWEKHLEIKPMQATEARTIQLIPINPDQDTIAEHISFFAVSPDNSTIALMHTDGTLSLTDAAGKLSTPALQIAGQISSIAWSPDSNYLALTNKSKLVTLIQFTNQTIQKVPTTASIPTQQDQWDPAQNHALVGINSLHQLVRYSIDQQTAEPIAESVQVFSFLNNQPLYQRIDNSIAQQGKQLIDSNKRVVQIIPSSHGEVALLFEGGEIALLDKNNSLHTISSSALSASWSPDGLILLIQTAQEELSLYNVSNDRIKTIPKNELHLLVRLSKPIMNPQWHTDSQHVFYQTDNQLIFSEIDPRDHSINGIISTAPSTVVAIAKDSESILGTISNTLTRTWLVTKEDR